MTTKRTVRQAQREARAIAFRHFRRDRIWGPSMILLSSIERDSRLFFDQVQIAETLQLENRRASNNTIEN
jgi:hypothetical protein